MFNKIKTEGDVTKVMELIAERRELREAVADLHNKVGVQPRLVSDRDICHPRQESRVHLPKWVVADVITALDGRADEITKILKDDWGIEG